ncbi:MAG: tRNA-dihydrouridine synthase family protein [Prevotellaceae bacterium]|nr:tRNA-dihydrouridine synthase family protein [Candidatus Minthosoma equi]
MKCFFAPLQGYTEDAYRRLHNDIFGGIDAYYSPFVRLEHGKVRSKDMRDIRPEFNEGVNLIPQIIARDAEEMHTLLDVILPLGYKSIDINMGCPFPLQTKHGRGAGLLECPEKVEQMMEIVKKNADISFSVKMRLGLNNEEDWKNILPILNDTPLHHITIHPRIASQQYKGTVNMDAFDAFLEASKHPVVYNGDIQTTDDIASLEKRYGDRLYGIMIGRGLLARPSLVWEYVNNTKLSDNELFEKILLMHDKLHEHYTRIIPGEAQQLSKLRTFWDYLEPTIGRKHWKKIMKAGNMKNYLMTLSPVPLSH